MPVPACGERRSLPFSLPLKDWPCPQTQGFFCAFFPSEQGVMALFPRLSSSLPNIFRFAFGFCKKVFLTCCLLLYKIQTQGRAEGSKVRGDRQKPDGSAAEFPQVPSTESRKPGRRKPPAGQRSTAGKGPGKAAEPGVSERGAPGLLAGSKPNFLSGESSRQGKAGAVQPSAPKVQGAVRLEDRHPLPAIRRGVMRKEKGARRPRFKARTALGGLCPTHNLNPQPSRLAA